MTGALWLFPALTVVLFGGWALGVLAWSETVPAKVTAAAEQEAGDRPYCLIVVGRPARTRRDLTGISLHAPNTGGYHFDFHALLVVDEPGKVAFNWSYRTRQFERLSDRMLAAVRLYKNFPCKTASHFARYLTMF